MLKKYFYVLFITTIIILKYNSIAISQTININEAVISALQYYKSLQAMQENRQSALYDLRQAKSGWGPRVDVTGQTGGSKLSDTTTRQFNSDKRLYLTGSTSATLTQPLWNGLATKNQVYIAQSRVASLDYRIIDNATKIALDAIIVYIDLIRNRKLFSYAQANVKEHERILKDQHSRKASGATTIADVTQTQGRLARAYSNLADAQSKLKESEASYYRVTGLSIPKKMQPVTISKKKLSNLKDILETAYKHNPKLLAYKEDINMAIGEKRLAKAPYQPNLNLEAGTGYSDRGGPGKEWSSFADAMLVLRWNIFKSGGDIAAVKAANARKRQVREEMLNFHDDLILEINNTWSQFISAQSQEKFYKDAVHYNKLTWKAFIEQFKIGQRNLLDVLDAISELYTSSNQLATAESNAIIGFYKLYALNGKLLSLLNINSSTLLKTVY